MGLAGLTLEGGLGCTQPLKKAKSVKKEEDVFAPEQLNELGEEGWEAVGLSLKYGDLIAWPVVLLKRPLV